MKQWFPIAAAILLLSVAALSQGQSGLHDPENQIKEGVVVEQVTKNSAADRGGVHNGDIILRWTRGDAGGRVATPFDLFWIESEQGPRGPVTLEILRDNQKVALRIGAGAWGIASRPNLQGDMLSIYHEGQDLAKAGKLPEAATRWKQAAQQAQQFQHGWAAAWFLFHSAEAWAGARIGKEADSAYQAALDNAGEPVEAVQILFRRARVFQQQHEWNQADKYYRQAMAEGEKLEPGGLLAARCMNNLGALFGRRGILDKAEEEFIKALAIRQKLAPDSLDVAETLDDLGIVETHRGNLLKAEEYSRRVVAITERLAPDSIDLAEDLNNLGYIMIQKGDLEAAAIFFQRALVLEEKLEPEHMSTASTLTNLGQIARQQGNLSKAGEYHRRSLEIRQNISPGGIEHSAGFHNLALVYAERGDLIEAEKLYLQAVAIFEKIAPAGPEMAMSLTNLGGLNHSRGDLETAGEYFRRALTIAEKVAPDNLQVAGLLGNLGSITEEEGDPARARAYFLRALSIIEKVAPASLDMTLALNNLARLEQEQRDGKQARQHLERALQIAEKLAPYGPLTAQSLSYLGDVDLQENDFAAAETRYRRALEIRAKLSPEHIEYAESLAALASLLRRKGQPDEAAKLFAQALDALENQIAILGGGEEISSNFRAKHVTYYKEYIDLLLQQKQIEPAFQVFERLRARELQAVVAARIDFGEGGNSLIARQHSLAADIAAKSSRRIRLFNGEPSEAQILALDKELRELETQLESVDSEIRRTNPDYAALTRPRSLSVKEVQEDLLDADTVLLEYDLGEERSYLWLVASDSTSVYDLPKRSEIETAARRLRDILIARNGGDKNEPDAERLARAKKADLEYPAAAAELGRMILRPVASRITHKRLFVVSDGILQYIPFAVLMVSGDPATTGVLRAAVVQDHEIVNLPSASVLAGLKKRLAGREPAAKAIAVLADPVFDINDPRVRTAQSAVKAPVAEKPAALSAGMALADKLSVSLMLRSASEIGMIQGQASFPRLFFSRTEAEAILQNIPAEQRLKALDFAASRATAMSGGLRHYRIVHFATHGLLNSEHPQLSGLVLSLVDAQRRPQNGFLSLSDIYHLNLRADLVVLSACETALGKEVQGEGLVGVARGFMYAGASSVVASLWKVDDLATAEFMKIFYKGMLKDKLPPAAALRHAQMEMSKRRAAPYFWAGFVLQGAP